MNEAITADADRTRAWLAVPAPVHADATPGGGRLAVTTVRVAPGTVDEVTHLCLVDVASAAAERFAPALDGDHTATWSPDGSRLAFLTARTGTVQVAVASVLGGDAAVVTDLPAGARGPVSWSPDGHRLVVAAPRGRAVDRSLPYRITRPVPWADAIGALDDPPQLWLCSLDTGACTMLTDDEWRWSLPRWSPDGRTIAARASHDPTGHRRGAHLRVVVVDEGGWHAPDVPGGSLVVPAWAADGTLVVLVVQPEGGHLGARGEVHAVGPDGVRHLTAGSTFGAGGDVYGDSPASLGEAYDSALLVAGTDVYVRSHDGGRMGVRRTSLTGDPRWATVVSGERAATPLAVGVAGLVVATQSARHPCHLAVIDPADPAGTTRRLPAAGDERGHPSSAEVRRLTVPSPVDGAPLEAWFLAPADAGGPAPTVLLVHGGPNAAFGECFSFDAQALCAAGFGVLVTNPHGSTGYGDAFTHAVIDDWGGAPVRDVLAVVDHAVGLGWVDGDRLGMTGNSYGGYLTAWLACTTDRFRAAVVENPVTDLLSMYGTSDIGAVFLPPQLGAGPPWERVEPYLRWSPLLHASTCRTPVLFVVGADDHRCPPSQAFELHRALHVVGTPSEVLVLPGCSHEGSTIGPVPARLAHDSALVGWMRRWVTAAQA